MKDLQHPTIMTQPNPIAKERAIAEALRHYRRYEYETANKPRVFAALFSQWKGFATGALAMLLVTVLVVRPTTPSLITNADSADIAMLQEMKQVFGTQLQGVVQDGNNLQPVVSRAGAYTNSQPIIITLQQGNKTLRILSFSGNTVNVPLQEGNVNLSTYVNKDGAVFVEGDNFLWSKDKSEGAVPAKLDAKTLGTSL